MGDARGGRSAGGSVNAVRDDIYREMECNRGIVNGVTSTIQSVCKGERM